MIGEGKIIIKPEFDKQDIRLVGIRVHLAKDILVPEPGQMVDFANPTDLKYKEVDISQQEFILEPGGFILAATHEAIQTPPNILAVLDGRTTIARLGLTTHVTASVCDGTFEIPHVIVLEIKNIGNFNIKLPFKLPIAEIIFTELTEPVTQKISSQYGAGQNKVTPPNLKFKTK